VPHHGQKRELVNMAVTNAVETLNHLRAQWATDETKHTHALTALQEALSLSEPPTRIEGYDISNTQGTGIVGAMVVFVKGMPRKSDYRKFKIQSVVGEPNDFASLQEMLRRRFKRYANEAEAEPTAKGALALKDIGKKHDASFAVLPDLIMIDGGKGQLSAAVAVLQEFGLDQIPVVSLAKQEEEIFRPNESQSIRLPRESEALQLLQRVRDEVHRFGITFHRQVREKKSFASQLDEIPSIGPKRRQVLLKKFGSLDAIRNASLEELAQVKGMNLSAAQQVKASL
jgi:excinuclease ABC subunit C